MINLTKPPIEMRNGYKDKKRMADIHNIPCSLSYLKGWTQTSKTICHHKHGMGLGLKVSDLLTMSLAENHHHVGNQAFHNIGREAWEKMHGVTQDELIEVTNNLISKL